jgi:Protein of unknown function (DUF3105)
MKSNRVMMGVAAAAVVAIGAVGALTLITDDPAVCSAPQESIDPSPLHLVGDTEVTFELSPPTSGPHRVPAPTAGVYSVAIPEPQQVGSLESGLVLVQYDPKLDESARIELIDAIEGPNVVVAPAVRTMDDGAVVAFTAWGVRQMCSAVDTEAAVAFVDRRSRAFFTEHGE